MNRNKIQKKSILGSKKVKSLPVPGRFVEQLKKNTAEIRAYVDKSIITIGDKVRYTLEIDAEKTAKVRFPSYVSDLGGFAVRDFGKEQEKIGRRRVREKQWYLLDTYTTGSYVIPSQEVKIKLLSGHTQILRSPEIFIKVKSVIDKDKKKYSLRDIKEPLSVKDKMPVGLILSVIAVLAVVGFVIWRLYLKKNSLKKVIPLLSPYEEAMRELNRIEGLNLIDKGKIKGYYYMVSLCLRSYIERKFSINAPEQTTEEFLESASCSEKLERKYINILKGYLKHCDLVKYAKLNPGIVQSNKLIETTRKFIEETAEQEESNEGKSGDSAGSEPKKFGSLRENISEDKKKSM